MSETVEIDLGYGAVFLSQIKTFRAVLDRDGVIAYPTDTFYGLGVNPFREKAVSRLFEIKKRSPGKAILVLVASVEQVSTLASEISPEAEKLIRALWPGPLTLLMKARPDLPGTLTAQTGKVGVRLPANELTLRLIEGAGCPLTATSANLSGGENNRTAEGVAQALGSRVDLILNGGPTPGGQASTLLDTTVSPPVVVRRGAVPEERIESILKTG